MTFAPQSLLDLEKLWVANGGVALGIVGNAAHLLAGTSYHNGKDHLIAGAYSRIQPRDVAGLSLAASAIDLGRLHGSYFFLQAFSRWFVAEVRAHPTAYRDVREVIYSPDGTHVMRWDDVTNTLYHGGTGTGQGDDTHLTHTHISWYRDSERRAKTQLFAPYFAAGSPVLDPAGAPDMPGIAIDLNVTHDADPWPDLGRAVIKGVGHDLKRVYDGANGAVNVPDGTNLGIAQRGTIRAPAPSWAPVGTAIVAYTYAGMLHVSPLSDVTFTPLQPPADSTPFSQADKDAARSAGYADAKTRAIAAVQTI